MLDSVIINLGNNAVIHCLIVAIPVAANVPLNCKPPAKVVAGSAKTGKWLAGDTQ